MCSEGCKACVPVASMSLRACDSDNIIELKAHFGYKEDSGSRRPACSCAMAMKAMHACRGQLLVSAGLLFALLAHGHHNLHVWNLTLHFMQFCIWGGIAYGEQAGRQREFGRSSLIVCMLLAAGPGVGCVSPAQAQQRGLHWRHPCKTQLH